MPKLIQLCPSGLERIKLELKAILIGDKNPEQKQHNFQDWFYHTRVEAIENESITESVKEHKHEACFQPNSDIV